MSLCRCKRHESFDQEPHIHIHVHINTYNHVTFKAWILSPLLPPTLLFNLHANSNFVCASGHVFVFTPLINKWKMLFNIRFIEIICEKWLFFFLKDKVYINNMRCLIMIWVCVRIDIYMYWDKIIYYIFIYESIIFWYYNIIF